MKPLLALLLAVSAISQADLCEEVLLDLGSRTPVLQVNTTYLADGLNFEDRVALLVELSRIQATVALSSDGLLQEGVPTMFSQIDRRFPEIGLVHLKGAHGVYLMRMQSFSVLSVPTGDQEIIVPLEIDLSKMIGAVFYPNLPPRPTVAAPAAAKAVSIENDSMSRVSDYLSEGDTRASQIVDDILYERRGDRTPLVQLDRAEIRGLRLVVYFELCGSSVREVIQDIARGGTPERIFKLPTLAKAIPSVPGSVSASPMRTAIEWSDASVDEIELRMGENNMVAVSTVSQLLYKKGRSLVRRLDDMNVRGAQLEAYLKQCEGNVEILIGDILAGGSADKIRKINEAVPHQEAHSISAQTSF